MKRFDGCGFMTQPDVFGWTWGLELVRWGFLSAETTIETAARAHTDGQRVT